MDFRNESFHDAQINSVIVNEDIEICVDSMGVFTEKNNIIFKNAILVSGNIYEDYYWLYDEISDELKELILNAFKTKVFEPSVDPRYREFPKDPHV